MTPYTSEDYSLEFCKKRAKELRESGKYKRVVIRRKEPENGREYGRIYVERR